MNQPTQHLLRKFTNRRTCEKLSALAASLMIFASASPARATLLYWDTNGTTAGSGSTSTGTWGTSVDWNTDQTGVANSFTATTLSTDTLTFVAGPSVSSGNNPYTVSVSGTQSAGQIVFASTGAITLGASVGAGTINLGTGGLVLASNAYGSTPNSATPVINANVVLGGDQTWNIASSSSTLTVNGAISGTGNLLVTGNTNKSFTGANSYVGSTTIAGAAILTLGGTAGSVGTGDIILSGTFSGISLAQTTSQTIANNITGAGGSSGLQVVTGTTITLTGTNTYTGGTVVRGGGTLKVASIANNLGSTGASVIKLGLTGVSGTATLVYTGAGETTAKSFAINGSTGGTAVENDGSGALIFSGTFATTTGGVKTLFLQGTNTNDSAIQGVLADSGGALSVNKSGAGKWILGGANTYTGATTVSAGILGINGSLASGSAVTVGGTTASGATGTPTLIGTGTITGGVTVNGNSTGNVAGSLAPGSTATPQGTLKVGTVTFQSGSTFDVSINGANTSLLTATGTTAGAIALGSGATLSFAATSPTAGNYLLMQANGGGSASLTGTFGTVSSLPSGYTLVYGATTLNLQQNGILSIASTTATSFNGHVGSGYTIGVGVTDTAATGGANITYTLSGSTGVAISGSSQSATAGGTAVNTSGTYTVQAAGSNSVSVAASGTDSLGHSVSGSAAYTVVGYNLAVASAISSVNLGYVHTGGTFGTAALGIANGAAAGSYSEDLSASGSASGLATSTGSVSNLVAGSSNNSSVVVGLGGSANTGTAGAKSGSVAVSETSTGTVNGVSNGLGTTSLGTQNVSVSGTVYSGLSTWTAATSGSWGTITGTTPDSAFTGNWDQGAPGVTAGITGTDTATFGTHTSTPITVSLNGAAPNLNKVTFSSSTTGYTVAQGSGGSITLSGSTPIIAVTAGAHTISAPVILGAATSLAVAPGQKLTITGPISGSSYGLSTATTANGGGGTTIVTSDNTYGNGTTLSGGSFYVNNGGGASYTAPASSALRPITATNSTGSGTGAGSVTVASGATLGGSGTIAPTSGGVTVQNGGTFASGAVQTDYAHGGTGSVTGTGLTINNSSSLSSALLFNGGATLTFALGSSTAFNGGSGALNFANPNTNSTYLSLTGNTVDRIFGNTSIADTIKLVDLTNGAAAGGVSLTLRAQNPYLLIQTALGDNSDFGNLWTTGGLGQNGYVLGVSDGTATGYTAFNLSAVDINGNTLSSSTNLEGLKLYLFNGDLEVVPEPGTWALMLSGLALLVVIQRRKNNRG